MFMTSATDAFSPVYRYASIESTLRSRMRTRLGDLFSAGEPVLELGCGNGENAFWLAQRGVHVVATDTSERLCAAMSTQIEPSLSLIFEPLNLRHLPLTAFPNVECGTMGSFDHAFYGVFADFGTLNQVENWRNLAAWIATRIVPSGTAAFGITGNRQTLHRLTEAFAPYFRRRRVDPFGLLRAPDQAHSPYLPNSRLPVWLTILDHHLAQITRMVPLTAHFWVEFERVDVPSPVT